MSGAPVPSAGRAAAAGLVLVTLASSQFLIPFISDTQLQQAMSDAGATEELTSAVVEANQAARVQGLDAALAVLAILAVCSLFFSGRIPDHQPAGDPVRNERE